MEDNRAYGIHGRETELALIEDLLDEIAVNGRALLVSGEAGLGKSTLLEAASAQAEANGIRVLRTAGAEFEADLTYAGLNQLLIPLHHHIAGLPAALRDALTVALGFGDGDGPNRLLVCNAVLALLAATAPEAPVLVLLDDLHWMDRVSVEVLALVAPRLTGMRIGIIAAVRSDTVIADQLRTLPRLDLGPLSDEAAGLLLTARFPPMAATVRERVLREAQGNPLLIVEGSSALDADLQSGRVGLPPLLHSTRRINAIFQERTRRLPGPARRALLFAALEHTGDLARLKAAFGDDFAASIAPAEQIDLITISAKDGRLRFRHPLMRSAVVELTPAQDRRAAHRMLAVGCRDEPDRLAWHLAEGAEGPDESVAVLLDDVAQSAIRRGDLGASVNALTRGAALSSFPAERSRRLAEAAYLGAHAGHLAAAVELLSAARDANPALRGSLRDACTAAYLMMAQDADVDSAHLFLAASIEACADPSDAGDDALLEALHTLFIVCLLGGRAELWQALHTAIARLRPCPPPDLILRARLFGDPARATPDDLAALDAAVARLTTDTDPISITRTSITATFVGRLDQCREAVHLAVRRSHTDVAIEANGVRDLALNGFHNGHWDEAQQWATRGLERALSSGPGVIAAQFQWLLALLAAARGDEWESRRQTEALMRWSAPRRAFGFMHFGYQARMLAAIGRGDWTGAYENATAISPPGELPSHVPTAVWVCMDLVEAAVRTDRRAEAAAHVAVLEQTGIASISPHLGLLVTAARAMTAPEDAAEELFERALSVPTADRWPFDFARVQLAFGEHLRRVRSPGRSRVHLSAALQTFEWLGAIPWMERAAGDLRIAGGAPSVVPTPAEGEPLTPQELEIAQLAASGLSNKQIGTQLFLSHRTVANHLYRIFPKLGIVSRAGLRDALSISQQNRRV